MSAPRGALPDKLLMTRFFAAASFAVQCLALGSNAVAEAVFEDCRLATPGTTLRADARCAVLAVAENPQHPDGRQIELKIAVIPARSQPAEADAVVFIAGGPGQSAAETWLVVVKRIPITTRLTAA